MSARARNTTKNKPPLDPTQQRTTRSGGKGVSVSNVTSTGKAATKTKAKQAPKRKMSDAPAEKASKRICEKVQETIPVGGGGSNEAPDCVINPAEQVTVNKRTGRKAPSRPKLSLSSESEEDGHASDKDQSDIESEEEATNVLTAENLRKEYPTPTETVADESNYTRDTRTENMVDPQHIGGKRVEKILHEALLGNRTAGGVNDVPNAPIQLAHQPVYSLPNNLTLPPANTVLPSGLVNIPAPMLHPLPLVWPAIMDLVRRDDGHYRQSDQIPEIQACLSAAVQRANANLAFLDGFPDAVRKAKWLASALEKELKLRRNGTIAAVDDRAGHDEQYFNYLRSMITGRWSGFRQGVIDMAQALIVSQELTYHLWQDPTKVTDSQEVPQAAQKLLDADGYHFSKTAAGAVDTTTPYQHLEIAVALAYYFKGHKAVGVLFEEDMPTGQYGSQVPDAMVALTATAIQVALEERVAGRSSAFSERAYRDKYWNHIQTINVVKAWGDGGLRYTRMMSNIYKRTMSYLENGRPTPKPTTTVTIDVSRMAV